jgi:hypothetical protein
MLPIESWEAAMESCESSTQPSGAVIGTMVPHFGHARICPTAEALVTFNFAAQDLQMMEKGSTDASLQG